MKLKLPFEEDVLLIVALGVLAIAAIGMFLWITS
jgi:hypothetical protein